MYKFTEFETKYLLDKYPKLNIDKSKYVFRDVGRNLDTFLLDSNNKNNLIRVRQEFGEDTAVKFTKKLTITRKEKLNKDNNVNRREFNIEIDIVETSTEETLSMFESLGYRTQLHILKDSTHVFIGPDHVISICFVRNLNKYALEIELNRENIVDFTEEECYIRVNEIEKELGISGLKRENKSLYELCSESKVTDNYL